MQEEEKKKNLKDIIIFCLRIGVGVGIITWMIKNNYSHLMKSLEGFNYNWLIPAAILYFIHILAGAWKWYLLLKVQKIEIKYHEALSLTMQGTFFSLVLPGGSLGGDVIKGAFLAKRIPKGGKLNGAFTILMDRILGMISLFSLAGIAGILSYNLLKNVTGFMEFIVYALLAGCSAGLISTILIFFHRQLEKIPGVLFLIKIGDRITKNAISNLINAMDSFRSAWKTLLKTILISIVLVHLILSLVVYCITMGVNNNENITPVTYVLSTTLANAAGTIPATPSGVGTRDVVMEKIFIAAGLTPAEGVAIALIFTSLILIFNIFGGLFFILQRQKKPTLNK